MCKSTSVVRRLLVCAVLANLKLSEPVRRQCLPSFKDCLNSFKKNFDITNVLSVDVKWMTSLAKQLLPMKCLLY